MDNVQKEAHVVSVMTDQYKETCTVVRDAKDDRLLPHQIRRPRLTNGEKNPRKHHATKRKALKTKGAKIHAVTTIVKTPSCTFWHPPVGQNYKSETGCTYGHKCDFRHVGTNENPSSKSKKGGATGSVASLKECTQLGCVSQDSYPRKTLLREERKLGSRHAVKFSKGTWHPKNRERKGRSRGIIQKCELNERSPCSPKFEERSHEDTLHQERCARRVALDLPTTIDKLKNSDRTTF